METKDNLTKLAKNTKHIAENKFLNVLFTQVLRSSPILDKFSTWLLIGAGATASLMITNLEKISPIVGQTNFKDSIYILVASALFGFLAKFKFIYANTMLLVNEDIEQRAFSILQEYEEEKKKIEKLAKIQNREIDADIDFKHILKEYCKAFPWFMHSNIKRQFDEATKDQLSQGRKNANNVYWQGVYVTFQLLTFIFFMLFAVHNL